MQKLVEQQKEIDDLLRKVESLRIRRRETPLDGDRIDYTFVQSIQFSQQNNIEMLRHEVWFDPSKSYMRMHQLHRYIQALR